MSATKVRAGDLLGAVLRASEKAARIARACRAEERLFALLVEEKGAREKNPRFLRDFKTLADVLVQETVEHDLGRLFPALRGHIHGEESNKFTNANGDTVRVEVRSNREATAELLSKVLDGNEEAANLLADVVHSDVDHVPLDGVEADRTIDSASLGMWIDPIDSTSEYIAGNWEEEDEDGVAPSGLQCVCVLIGAYRLADGVPVMGVVNQPFRRRNGRGGYNGERYWCLCTEGDGVHSSLERLLDSRRRPLLLASTGEAPEVLDALRSRFDVRFAAGAGYKLLRVAAGAADAYVVSRGTTYRWDTCAPHAFLRALGGGIVSLRETLQGHGAAGNFAAEPQVEYRRETGAGDGAGRWCNASGIVAYRDLSVLREIIECLASIKPKRA